jgi:ribosomal protein S2
MPGDIVNLRLARKAKARLAREAKAEENRRFHGMTKAEREEIAGERRRLDRHLAGHEREKEGAER